MIVGIAALIIVAVMLHFHVKGAFCTGLIFGTLVWWFISGDYPDALVGNPSDGDKGRVIYVTYIFNDYICILYVCMYVCMYECIYYCVEKIMIFYMKC